MLRSLPAADNSPQWARRRQVAGLRAAIQISDRRLKRGLNPRFGLVRERFGNSLDGDEFGKPPRFLHHEAGQQLKIVGVAHKVALIKPFRRLCLAP
jgi:hypothetical protein